MGHEAEGGSLEVLLNHMRRIREAVPVNERLREELRVRLTEAQASGALTQRSGPEEEREAAFLSAKYRRPVVWLLLSACLLLAVGWIWWTLGAPKVLQAGVSKNINRFLLESSPTQFAYGAPGQGYLAVSGGNLLLLEQNGGRSGLVRPPTGLAYHLLALTPTGDKLALVRRDDTGGEELITISVPPELWRNGAEQEVEDSLARAETRWVVPPERVSSGLTWSPDGKTLAYTLGAAEEQKEIYLLTEEGEPLFLAQGQNPAWSPDGSRLVLERLDDSGRAALHLIGIDGVDLAFITYGERPTWGAKGYLAYVRPSVTERALTYSMDGSPLFTVRREQEEVRALSLGRNGEVALKQTERFYRADTLLLSAPEDSLTAETWRFLKNLEADGVREPRTILSDNVNSFRDLQFDARGEIIFSVQQHGGIVALTQTDVSEKLAWGVKGDEETPSIIQ